MDKTMIQYNKNLRQWELTGEIGEILQAFPPGPAGRRDAIIAQLEIEHPAALRLALDLERERPDLNGRALRGAQLVADGAVTISARIPSEAQVVSQTLQTTRYQVRDYGYGKEPEFYSRPSCSCSDLNPPGGLCKHAIAARFTRELEQMSTDLDLTAILASVEGRPDWWASIALPAVAETLGYRLEKKLPREMVQILTHGRDRVDEHRGLDAAGVDAGIMSYTEHQEHYHERR